MVVCGNKINKILHIIHTLLKSSTSKQDKCSTLKVVQELPLYKVKSRKHVHKKRITKLPPKCLIMNKISYTETRVKKQAEKVSKRVGTKLRAYKCEYCDYWHLTHKSNKLTMH